MRTTLTLDPDVAAEIERIRLEKGLPLRQVINDALRAGLMPRPRKSKKRFVTRTVDLGKPLLPNLDNVGEILDMLDEDEGYRL